MKRRRLSVSGFIFSLCTASAAWLLGSCAEGYDAPDGFDMGVRNTQMVTPIQDSISFVMSTDGKSATISWPLVPGADGHEVKFTNIDDPDNPVSVFDGIVDGSKMKVSIQEDSKYYFSIRTLGNKKLGNKDDDAVTDSVFTTGVPTIATLPSGTVLNEYFKENPLDTLDGEWAIDLEAGGEYFLTDSLDFGINQLTLRGNKARRPVITVQGLGTIYMCGGIKIKYINFDCSESNTTAIVGMSPKEHCPDYILSQNLGYTRGGSPVNGIYIVLNPIYISHCWFKDLPRALVSDGGRGGLGNASGTDCAYWNVTVDDCIVQGKNTSSEGAFCLQRKGRNIKNLTLSNSTFCNVEDNDQAYFLRYSNQSNANPEKVWGDVNSVMKSQSITISHCTLSKVYTKQKFVNNLNANGQVLSIDHSIFYDINSVRQLPRFGGNKTFKFNFWWGITQIDNEDKTQKDTGGSPFAFCDFDPQYGDVLKSMDFSKPNGGLEFTPGEYQMISNNAGDPRWLPNGGSTDEE